MFLEPRPCGFYWPENTHAVCFDGAIAISPNSLWRFVAQSIACGKPSDSTISLIQV